MSTYVYGITAASHPSLPDGMAGVGEPSLPVRVLRKGDLAAVVSDAPEGLRPERRNLLAHQNVLAETGAAGVVLPLRFGSVAPDDGTVSAVLEERSEHYKERLEALDDRVEYTIRATPDEEAVLHRVMADNPEIRAVAEANRQDGGGTYEQRLRLGELVTAAVRAREAEDATDVRQALEPVADAVSVDPGADGRLTGVSFLVPRDSAETFLATAERLRESHAHLELRINGPLPPYSFVEPGPAAPAGAGISSGMAAEE